MIEGSLAWNPQATLALVTMSSRASSSPSVHCPNPSPRSEFTSTLGIFHSQVQVGHTAGRLCAPAWWSPTVGSSRPPGNSSRPETLPMSAPGTSRAPRRVHPRPAALPGLVDGMIIRMMGWLDLSAGASGDMLLGALVDAGVPLDVPAAAVAALPVERMRLVTEQTARHGLGATRVHVHAPPSSEHRTWADVRTILADADLAPTVRDGALAVFERLALAEGRVHRVSADEVHFHEVGALDALADVVGVVAGFEHLGLSRLAASPVALGSGSARGAHGVVPVPGPAVLELLAGVPVVAGAVPAEMCTPTGAALVAHLVEEWTTLPPMRVERVGAGAGGRDPDELPNVVRLVLGSAAEPVATPV